MNKVTIIGLSLVLAVSQGCSVYKAATQPSSVDLTGLGVGTPRTELIGRLGAPASTSLNPDGTREDIFNFLSGLHDASKARVILYIVADLFTLTAAELVLWPLEMTVMDAASCTAYAAYDKAQTVETLKVTQKSGVQGC